MNEERNREREQLTEQIETLKEHLTNSQEQQKRLTALITDQRSEEEKQHRQIASQHVNCLYVVFFVEQSQQGPPQRFHDSPFSSRRAQRTPASQQQR